MHAALTQHQEQECSAKCTTVVVWWWCSRSKECSPCCLFESFSWNPLLFSAKIERRSTSNCRRCSLYIRICTYLLLGDGHTICVCPSKVGSSLVLEGCPCLASRLAGWLASMKGDLGTRLLLAPFLNSTQVRSFALNWEPKIEEGNSEEGRS